MVESYTLKPNASKVVLRNLIVVAGPVLLIALAIIGFHLLVGLDNFLALFEFFGVNVNTKKVILYPLMFAALFIAIIILGNLAAAKNIRYEVYRDKIIVYRNVLFVLISPKEIPYQNILRVAYSTDGIFNKLFRCGTVTIETSGMKERDKIKLEFMDNPREMADYIYKVVQRSKSTQQAEFSAQYRIDSIADRY